MLNWLLRKRCDYKETLPLKQQGDTNIPGQALFDNDNIL